MAGKRGKRRESAGWTAMREVLGDEYVDRAKAAQDPFVTAFRDAAVTICWDTAWARPGLDRRTRSLLTLAMLTAGGRTAEIELHAPAALRNGATREEILETMIHAAAYCGVPAALDGVRSALRGLKPRKS